MLPLSLWQLHARNLPDELAAFPKDVSFSLPGAKALKDFADLLGDAPSVPADESAEESIEAKEETAPFSLPAMLPDNLEGPVSLHREIDFGGLMGDRAVLTIDQIIGKGRILLGDSVLCAFDSAHFTDEAMLAAHAMTAQPCMLAVNLSEALELGRKDTLIIEFDESRPAGIPGPVLLQTTYGAHLANVSLLPDGKQQTISVRTQIKCIRDGKYILRTQGFSSGGTMIAERELPLVLSQSETHPVNFSFGFPLPAFLPGTPCDMPAVRLQLFAQNEKTKQDGMLCDSVTLMCGYVGKAPEAWLPLDRATAFAGPQKTIETLRALRIPAVSLDAPAPDGLYRAFARAGIAIKQYMPENHPLRKALSRFPCLSLSDMPAPNTAVSLEESAWQLGSMVSSPRTLEDALTPKELLREVTGMPLNPKETGVRDTLLWLRALSIRLRAEAARQGRYHGALCNAGEEALDDAAAALATAFAPLHLSAVPLCGAWWTGTRFSASLEAFIPRDTYGSGAALSAQAVLEDGEGNELARFSSPCRTCGGYVGVIEAALPDHPCVLELTTRLLLGKTVIEESMMPIYVGDRGQLEAAFM